jgi:hypothetical protein
MHGQIYSPASIGAVLANLQESIMQNDIRQSFCHSTNISQLQDQRTPAMNKSAFIVRIAATISLFNRKRLLLAAVLWALLGSASVCEADHFTGHVYALAFPSGAVLETLDVNDQCLNPVTETAPATLSVGGVTYEFLFWNIDAKRDTAATVTFKPGCGVNNAFVWYLGLGSGCPPTERCPSGVPTWAFSLNQNAVIAKTTPIEEVWPSGAWTGPPSTFVSTDISPESVTIEARPKIDGYGRFADWQLLPSESISAREFRVTAGSSAYAIAFYGYPDPDPCQTYRNELFSAEISVACIAIPEFPSCQPLLKKLKAELNVCEVEYGE